MPTSRSNIRNISILAHVDHGKTTLADSLVASNGIIPQRQAGKLRYMDSRDDEQARGITMKSSAISLCHKQGDEGYLINLIDSPGHVDFSSEVSTAVRLSDGALLVIDVVEGVCSQTQVVLQQAWEEGVKLCLVLNKIDRLIIELQQTPTEAYYHLQQVLEQVNAVTGSLFTSKIMEAASRKQEDTLSPTSPLPAKTGEMVYNWSVGLEDVDDSALYFSPEKGNVVFMSALDGWGFSLGDFASMYANKLGLKVEVLQRTLWGDFFLSTKAKRIFKGAQTKGKKPIFVQFVLENIWEVYKAVLIDRNKERIEKIVKSMNLKISARDSQHANPKIHLFSLCSQWLPLAKTVLDMVVNQLPSPLELTEERVEKLMCGAARTFGSLPLKSQLLKNDFLSCSIEESSPILIFVSKFFIIDKTALAQNQNRSLTTAEIAQRGLMARQRHHAKMASKEEAAEETTSAPEASSFSSAEKKLVTEEEEELQAKPETALSSTVFLAFSRIFSGVVKKGQELFVLQPRYDPREAILEGQVGPLPPHVCKFTVEGLYTLMGRSVLPVESVSAGNIMGIAGLQESIVKSGTVSSTLACPAFSTMAAVASPIVRVAIEPLHVSDLPALVSGMKLLNQADPSVKVYVQETGEHVLAASGEVHLQKCLDDLEKQYACVKLNVSEPIIPFRETVVIPPKVDMVNEDISAENELKLVTQALGEATLPRSSGVEERDESASTSSEIKIQTSNKACSLLLEARPLPAECVKIVEENPLLLKALNLVQSSAGKKDIVLNSDILAELRELRSKLKFALQPLESELEIKELVDHIWCFGPRNTGPNMLLNAVENYSRPSMWQAIESNPSTCGVPLHEFDNSIVSGFQLATLSGPLCEEPMHGVCILVKEWNYATTEDQPSRNKIPESSHYSISDFRNPLVPLKGPTTCGPFSGQLISSMKEGCRRAYLAQPARLMAAMYTSNILATADVLGKVYSVLGRRNGRVLSENMIEGSSIFNIQALLPVAESFGFAEEMRKRTSGFANPQLIFSHWEVIPSDPFWVPSTDEELLHFGEKADCGNIARKYMNNVRKKKGLLVDEKIVEHGEKQRTLKKNK